jgi:hypothetical protein
MLTNDASLTEKLREGCDGNQCEQPIFTRMRVRYSKVPVNSKRGFISRPLNAYIAKTLIYFIFFMCLIASFLYKFIIKINNVLTDLNLFLSFVLTTLEIGPRFRTQRE